MKFQRIQREKANYPVAVMCEGLGVSRSGYYAFEKRSLSKRAIEDIHIGIEIAESFRRSRRSYGSPRVHRDLIDNGRHVSRKRVARIMRSKGLCARSRRRFKATTVTDPEHAKQSNILDRQFSAEAPDRVWLSDLTALWTHEGWLYVVAILDLFARRIVGWRAAATADAAMCVRAFEDAVQVRRPAPGLLFHSDRGCQYTSVPFQESVRRAGATSSMSRKGNCWDNAPMESFWSSMKTEMESSVPATRIEARRRVFDYIEAFYNPRRRHSTLGHVSPNQFEEAAARLKAA
jgi:transposase InsO family protein